VGGGLRLTQCFDEDWCKSLRVRALERAQGEDQEGELVSVLLGEAPSGTVRAEPKADAGTAT